MDCPSDIRLRVSNNLFHVGLRNYVCARINSCVCVYEGGEEGVESGGGGGGGKAQGQGGGI